MTPTTCSTTWAHGISSGTVTCGGSSGTLFSEGSQDAKVLEESFEKPDDFDVKHYFHSSFGIYKGADKAAGRRCAFLRPSQNGSKARYGTGTRKQDVLKDGSLELSFPVADFSEVKMEILRHGDQVKVIGPKRLRDLIKDEAEKIALIYR